MNIQMLIKKLDCELENEISKSKVNLNELTEIRLRTNQYLQLLFGNNEKIIKYKINKKILQNIILSLTDYSVYSIEQDLKKGFFTIAGGD